MQTITRVQVKLVLLAALGCYWMGSSFQVYGHGELHELIEQTTQQIQKNPNKPELYLKRGQMHRLHRDWDDAIADLERAEALSNQWRILYFERAQVFMDAEWFKSAKVAVDRFLAHQPNHAEACLLRARVRNKLGERMGAVDDYNRAIANSPSPAPELYLERSQLLVTEGGPHAEEALRGLEQGIAKLGPLATLQLAAIDVELKLKRVDAALARVDQAMALVPRKETWLLRRADILREAGRSQAAAEAYQAALKELEKLPPARRNVPATAELEKRIRTGLTAVQQ